jgi:cytoplasmic iron level regulating protein YaaA (DUF328/UPF0246 family)
MLILLSPAKSLDFSSPSVVNSTSQIQFPAETQYLAGVASQLTSSDLQMLMKISPDLANLNTERFAQLTNVGAPIVQRQAVFAFDGDVYSGLQARGLGRKEINYLQKHLRILSGLYGLLRPLDLIQAYRLEMGSTLKNVAGNNLYAYWTNKLTAQVNLELQDSKSKFLLNLASEEYSKAVQLKSLPVPVIQPIFQDFSSGKFKVISFFAKKARGSMARFCAVNQIKKSSDLKNFDWDSYRFIEEESDATNWVFRRRA